MAKGKEKKKAKKRGKAASTSGKAKKTTVREKLIEIAVALGNDRGSARKSAGQVTRRAKEYFAKNPKKRSFDAFIGYGRSWDEITLCRGKGGKVLLGPMPSQVKDEYWLYAERGKGRYHKSTARSGKWLIFVNAESIDEVWVKIRDATEEGRLGGSAKVATSASGRPDGVICVYTYDWTDEKDVRRVRVELRKLGMERKIPYKSDEDTLAGKYAICGDKRISKYFE